MITRLTGVVSELPGRPAARPASQPGPDESLAEWARRCWDQERFSTRIERGARLARLIERTLGWPAERLTLSYSLDSHEAYARVDGALFRLVEDQRHGDVLLVAGDSAWHQVASAAELYRLLRRGAVEVAR